MKYSKLGTTDLEVSKICLGTMTFGAQNSEADAHEQLNYAIEQGINFIDTAEMYAVPPTPENQGLTEKYIGSWLKDRTDRDKIIIATKVTGPSATFTYISENLGYSKARINEAIDLSLSRLQTDYVDLYQLHWPERPTNMFGARGYTQDAGLKGEAFESVLDTLNELKVAGKIRHYGLSNETSWGTMSWLAAAKAKGYEPMMSIQNPYNLLNRTFEVGNAEVAIREKIGLLAYSPLAFGWLSGKYHRGTDTPENRINISDRYVRYNSTQCYEAIKRYLAIADKFNLNFSQMSLAFINTRDFLTSTIIGATTMDQLKENIGSIDIEIPEEALKEIEKVQTDIPNPAP